MKDWCHRTFQALNEGEGEFLDNSQGGSLKRRVKWFSSIKNILTWWGKINPIFVISMKKYPLKHVFIVQFWPSINANQCSQLDNIFARHKLKKEKEGRKEKNKWDRHNESVFICLPFYLSLLPLRRAERDTGLARCSNQACSIEISLWAAETAVYDRLVQKPQRSPSSSILVSYI